MYIYFATKTFVDLQVEAYSHVYVYNYLFHVYKEMIVLI